MNTDTNHLPSKVTVKTRKENKGKLVFCFSKINAGCSISRKYLSQNNAHKRFKKDLQNNIITAPSQLIM